MRLFLTLAACLLATSAAAHESWLNPGPGAAKVGKPFAVDFTSGTAFPTPEAGPAPDRVDEATVDIEDEVLPATVVVPGAKALRLAFTPHRAGVAVVKVNLHPRDITLDPAEVEEYLAEADPEQKVRDVWATYDGAPWKEIYVKTTKLLVCVAPCADSTTAMTPSGAMVEFIALEPGPTPRRFKLIMISGTFIAPRRTVRLFVPGQPPRVLKTDHKGEIALPDDVQGPVMLSSIWLIGGEGKPFRSFFTSIVVGR